MFRCGKDNEFAYIGAIVQDDKRETVIQQLRQDSSILRIHFAGTGDDPLDLGDRSSGSACLVDGLSARRHPLKSLAFDCICFAKYPGEANAVVSILQERRQLDAVEFHDCQFGGMDFSPFANALKTQDGLKSFYMFNGEDGLDGCMLDVGDTEMLLKAIGGSPCLQHMSLLDCSIEGQALRQLCFVLRNHRGLESLQIRGKPGYFRNNNAEREMLVEAIRSNTTLRSIKVSGEMDECRAFLDVTSSRVSRRNKDIHNIEQTTLPVALWPRAAEKYMSRNETCVSTLAMCCLKKMRQTVAEQCT